MVDRVDEANAAKEGESIIGVPVGTPAPMGTEGWIAMAWWCRRGEDTVEAKGTVD